MKKTLGFDDTKVLFVGKLKDGVPQRCWHNDVVVFLEDALVDRQGVTELVEGSQVLVPAFEGILLRTCARTGSSLVALAISSRAMPLDVAWFTIILMYSCVSATWTQLTYSVRSSSVDDSRFRDKVPAALLQPGWYVTVYR